MKTVSHKTAAELVKAGWAEETHAHYRLHDLMNGELWIRHCRVPLIRGDTWLPAPSAGEIGERVSYEKLFTYWEDHFQPRARVGGAVYWSRFAEWLHSTLLDPDKMALVWIQTKSMVDKSS